MFGRKKLPRVNNLIGPGTHVAGNVTFSGTLHVEGSITGDVTAVPDTPSAVVLGPAAQIEGSLSAQHIVLAGSVFGPVTATEQLELHATALIEGDVRYKTMEMQPGATVAGEFRPQIVVPAQATATAAAEDAAERPEQTRLEQPSEPTLDPDLPLQTEPE